jgi:hypothetical protein
MRAVIRIFWERTDLSTKERFRNTIIQSNLQKGTTSLQGTFIVALPVL